MGSAEGRLPGSLHLVVATLNLCGPLVGAGKRQPIKETAPLRRGEKTEVYLSQNRASLEASGFYNDQLGSPAASGPSLGPLAMWRQGAQSRQGVGGTSLSSHCLGFLGREDGSSLPGSYSEGPCNPGP